MKSSWCIYMVLLLTTAHLFLLPLVHSQEEGGLANLWTPVSASHANGSSHSPAGTRSPNFPYAAAPDHDEEAAAAAAAAASSPSKRKSGGSKRPGGGVGGSSAKLKPVPSPADEHPASWIGTIEDQEVRRGGRGWMRDAAWAWAWLGLRERGCACVYMPVCRHTSPQVHTPAASANRIDS